MSNADKLTLQSMTVTITYGDGMSKTTNLVDALAYETGSAEAQSLWALLGLSGQVIEGPNNNTDSIQRFDDGLGNPDSISYLATIPTPRALNDGSGIILNGILH